MYHTILFPTDGSDGAEAALAHAVDHAERYDADLHALFVADTAYDRSGMVGERHEEQTADLVGAEHESTTSGMTADDHDPMAAMESAGQSILDDVADAVDVPVTTAVRQGDPHETIVDYADSVDADLIVMGTHGRTGVDRYLLGSVTERVVRTADAPVLTVRLE